MPFLIITPEASGHPARPGRVLSPEQECTPLRYEFDWWLGDDFVGSPPHFLVTSRIRKALAGLPDATGFTLEEAQVAPSDFFKNGNPGRNLPRFWRLNVTGIPGVHDVGLSERRDVVVSGRVFAALLSGRLEQASFQQFRIARD